ncbi:hypothetical protein CDCA_CDCA13G3700 [Cyanidium caldarium]|uniref:ABC1 atypical kinase-like domain-containing protein n=1 Tax=Cyanidium caldarium TaxID=2771 RepID=A0AAV9J028_CYACA|nr:hypothetical protein CDCA_CDCA13G3700 [Cyanidium caldarium]
MLLRAVSRRLPRQRWARRAAAVLATTTAVVGCTHQVLADAATPTWRQAPATEEHEQESLSSWTVHTDYASQVAAAQRFLRCVTTAASIVADYKLTLARLPLMRVWEGEEAAARPVDASAVHRRSAAKLYRLCERNGGIYIKLGQHLAQLDYLLPDEYCEAMRPLLNACPTQPLSEVEATLREDLGITSLTEAFAEFEPQPIASASLAQVHRARLRPDRIHEANASDDGASAFPLVVAVKVQHRGLAEACQGDIATVQFLVTAAQRLFPGSFDYQWLVDEIRDNLPRELDFQLERCNGERCAHQLHTVRDADGRERARPRPDVRVPQFLPQLSSHRVLTMSYEHGVPVHDVNGIQRLGLRLRDVAAVVNDVFTDQIFIHGFVHSDPHAGNILVRPRDDDASRPLIVLLDHGLYRELDDTFRLRYAALWQGIVGGDSRGIRTQALAMGVPEADVELFTSMLTTRSWREVVRDDDDDDDDDATRWQRLQYVGVHSEADKQRVQAFARERAPDIGRVLSRVPRPLLLLLKTNDCLRAVDRRLGSPVSMVEMIARKANVALMQAAAAGEAVLAESANNHVEGMSGKRRPLSVLWQWRALWSRLRLEVRLLAFRLLVWWHQVRATVEGQWREWCPRKYRQRGRRATKAPPGGHDVG